MAGIRPLWLVSSNVALSVDMGDGPGERPQWLRAPSYSRYPPESVTPTSWLPRDATPEIYAQIAEYAVSFCGSRTSEQWWREVGFHARNCKNAALLDQRYGSPGNWIVGRQTDENRTDR